MEKLQTIKLERVLSIGWLALGLSILAITFRDTQDAYWQPSWLVFGLAASLFAIALSIYLFFSIRGKKPFVLTGATLFILYWVYLFLISPPDEVNQYSITGGAVLCLAILTIGSLLTTQKRKVPESI